MELDKNIQEKVKQYQPSPERLDAVRDVPLLFLVGISGAGKNALMQRLLSEYPNEYHEFVTHTTRAPRQNHGVMERDGVEYHFITVETAQTMLEHKLYIEANVYGNNIYGTSLNEMLAAKKEGRIVIGDIDVNGVDSFINCGLAVKPVFILPPSYDIWQQRLLSRYHGNAIDREDWERRMHTAYDEIKHAMDDEHYYLVINDDLAETASVINDIAHGTENSKHPENSMAIAQGILDGIATALQK